MPDSALLAAIRPVRGLAKISTRTDFWVPFDLGQPYVNCSAD